MSKIILTCTHDDFHAVHAAVAAAREGSETVKVPRAALASLLADHSKLIAEFGPKQIGGVT